MTKQLLLAIAIIFLASSCSNKFGVMKRRYNKGYYVSSSKTSHSVKKEKDPVRENTKDLKGNDELVQTQMVPGPSEVPNSPTAKTSAPFSKSSSKSQHTVKALEQGDNGTFETEDKIPPLSDRKILKKALRDHYSKHGDGDVELILLFILAIFIPPLAIYLKGHSTNKWFWITLVLCILTFSIFFFVFGGLLWLIAMIIAMLYIFDAI